MSKLRMRNGIIGALVVGLLLIGYHTPVSAASLFFFKGPTKAPNERICLRFAKSEATRHNLQNIAHDNLGVGGTRDNFFAVMTCVGNVIVVMVSGDTGTNGSPLAKELFDAVRKTVCIDSCD